MRFISRFNLVRDFNHILMLNMYFNNLKCVCVCVRVCVCVCVRVCVCIQLLMCLWWTAVYLDMKVVISVFSVSTVLDIRMKSNAGARYKDQSCYTVGRNDTSQNSSVQISDDGRRSFTVLMTGLRRTDSGWYFCFTGNKLSPVHLTVTETEPDKEKDTSVFKSLLLTFLRIVFVEWICIFSAFCCHVLFPQFFFHFYSNNHFFQPGLKKLRTSVQWRLANKGR